MSNRHYNQQGSPLGNSTALAADMRGEFRAIQAGFDRVPGYAGALTGIPKYALVVNDGGSEWGFKSYAPAPVAWTPTLTFAVPGDLSVAYTTRAGWYWRLGNIFYVQAQIETSTWTWTTASGSLKVTGFPGYSYLANISFPWPALLGGATGLPAGCAHVQLLTNYFWFFVSAPGLPFSTLVETTHCPSGTQQKVWFSIAFTTNSIFP